MHHNQKEEQRFTRKTDPWIVSMQRPAPGGNVRSAHAETETISGTSTLMEGLLVGESPDCGRLGE